MLKNYLKITFRNLLKHKVFSLVNILGLVAGMTCSFLIIIYVLYEFSYDRFNKNAHDIYRLDRELTTAEGTIREPLSSPPAALALEKDLPGISEVVRFHNAGKSIIKYEDKQFYEDHVWYADSSVFDIFSFPMVDGDPKMALVKPYSAVITEEMATKYFGAANPVGKILRINNSHDYVVTGVIKNIPDNSHLEINILLSLETLYAEKDPSLENWLSFEDQTYVLLKSDVDYQAVEKNFPALIDKYIGAELKGQGKSIRFFLFPLTKIHLYSHLEGYPPGRITQVYFFLMFAMCIILIACLNFINLSTARSASRAKEVGIRKVVGADRTKLIFQFIGEAVILSTTSFIFALVLVELLLPAFGSIIGQNIKFSFTEEPVLSLGFFGLAILVGAAAGSYPAFYLSRFQPVQVMKGELTVGATKASLRSTFVVLQFFASTVFIIQTIVLGYQIRYMRNKDLGFNKHDVVVLPIADSEVRKSIQSLKKEFKNYSGIIDVGATSTLPGWNIPRDFEIPQGYTKEQMQLMDVLNVDCDFIPTMEIKLAGGRNFSEKFPADTDNGLIINETAARKFGWSDPIGKTIRYNTGHGDFATGTVCGVVKDFHLASLYRVIEPLCISDKPDELNYILVQISPQNTDQTLDYIGKKWKEIYPDHPFEYSFLEQSFDRYFQVVEKVLQICSYFTFMAIVIACLGIYALAAYTAEHRTKEIGIRKVLGATTFGILLKLNKETIKLVVISMVLALIFVQVPLIDLHEFLPYFVKPGFMVYVESALLLISVALATISYQSIKTALANPVESLRYE
jgi:putative ABC transport system permease protein